MTKDRIIDFIVLCLRWYLIWYMISYGWSKLNLNQFGVNNTSILETPLSEVDKFYIAWHLYGESHFFNIVTGLIEIFGGILLIFNRTVLLGALIILTTLMQILIIDIAFTTNQFGYALPIRISGMILCTLLILIYYKERVAAAINNLTNGVKTKFNYNWWVYLVLPIIGFLMDFVFAILSLPIKLLLDKIF